MPLNHARMLNLERHMENQTPTTQPTINKRAEAMKAAWAKRKKLAKKAGTKKIPTLKRSAKPSKLTLTEELNSMISVAKITGVHELSIERDGVTFYVRFNEHSPVAQANPA